MKHCPRCNEDLPLSEFGVCRARKDGMNLYCKLCIRQKIALSRQALREYKKANPRTRPVHIKLGFSARRIARMLRKLSPSDRVREAISHGAHTQKEIAAVTKLPKDEVCDALANLLLWTRQIRTQIVRHRRMYFVNDTPGQSPPREPVKPREPPQSYGISPAYSSVYLQDVLAKEA